MGCWRYGPLFSGEVAIFWLILMAVNISGYGPDNPMQEHSWYVSTSLMIVILAMGAGEARFHLYRRVWSVASLNDAVAIGLAVVEASLLVTIINLLFPDGDRPLRVLAPILAAPAIVIGIGLLRLLPRLLASARPTGNRLLVVIPDAGGYPTVRALVQQSNAGWSPVAVVSVGVADSGRTLMGVPVVGTASNLSRWIKMFGVQGVAFVQGSGLDRSQTKKLYAVCLAAQLPVFTVPSSVEWFPRPAIARLRQLSADDLVGREQRELDLAGAKAEVKERTVLITGAAGSIGSELCRLLARMQPRRLVLVDTDESGLFDMGEELQQTPGIEFRQALVSINNKEQLLELFAEERPQVVFHAAAYKHVPMLEAHPTQAVLTNVIGTRNTLQCAHAAGVKKFVLISTDKAAARHSVMGCTKRICELLVLAYRGSMSCWPVRFGNVVGSRGSVVPLFERRIEHGGPVTITRRDVSRYMMTIREAASLVLSTLANGAANRLYMLDMGEPIRIHDLALDLIRSRGLRPDVDVKVVFTGLRPGERMTEELLAPDEGWRPTQNPAIREVISPAVGNNEDLAWIVERLEHLARGGRSDELVRALKNAVQVHADAVEEPELRPSVDERAPHRVDAQGGPRAAHRPCQDRRR